MGHSYFLLNFSRTSMAFFNLRWTPGGPLELPWKHYSKHIVPMFICMMVLQRKSALWYICIFYFFYKGFLSLSLTHTVSLYAHYIYTCTDILYPQYYTHSYPVCSLYTHIHNYFRCRTLFQMYTLCKSSV